MTLHLVKLCVGAATPDALLEWQQGRKAAGHAPIVHTRQTPKRAADLMDGGSLYRVFKGVILTRQRILAVETLGEGVARHCEILLDETLIYTAPQPRRAFQGWRYLETNEAPADLATAADGDMPIELARRLREIGAF